MELANKSTPSTSRQKVKSGSTSDRYTLEALLKEAAVYIPASDLKVIENAYILAEEAHRGVLRKSGEPYIQHPLAVAIILVHMRMDAYAIAAALLHDVVEDTNFTIEYVRDKFGPTIANVVDGVTKFNAIEQKKEKLGSQSEQETSTEDTKSAESEDVSTDQGEEKQKKRTRENTWRQQAETVRKMFFAMAEDPRVVVLKLADRLHNMRTLDAMSSSQQQAKARETREIYAPLAGRLGMSVVKAELEDLAFKYLEPEKFKWLNEQVAEEREQRKVYVERVCEILRKEMKEAGIEAEISGRIKHLSSIYKKIVRTGIDVSQVHDLIAFRIIVNTVHDCYLALGHIHGLWRPKDGRIKDYIANPKLNGYQSLHTTVFCLDERLAEIQIRTDEMHRVAEYGVATHWYYKESGSSGISRKEMLAWIDQLRDWQRELQSATEFVETLKDDVFRDQIFIFTPKGDVKDLPVGSTPLDFAYRVHSDIGDHCVGARIITDSERLITRLVPLDYELKNGEIVDIVTSKNAHPTRDWLSFVRTSNAKQKIRHYLKTYERDIDIQIGQDRVDKELKTNGFRGLESLTDEEMDAAAKELGETGKDDLLAAIGREEIRPHTFFLKVQDKLQAREGKTEETVAAPSTAASKVKSAKLNVAGMSGLLTRLASCCCPLPGDKVVGFISRGKGVVVHRKDCKNLVRIQEREQERLIEVMWDEVDQQHYQVSIAITAQDRTGLLRDIATVVADAGINMAAVEFTSNQSSHRAVINTTLELDSIQQLQYILTKLERIKGVFSVERTMRA